MKMDDNENEAKIAIILSLNMASVIQGCSYVADVFLNDHFYDIFGFNYMWL